MPAYDRERLAAWIGLWFVGRAVGKTCTELLGIVECPDSCVLPQHRDRWELVDGPFGKHYRCRMCQRFIGYPTPTKPSPAARR